MKIESPNSNRRQFLKAAGMTIALPALESFAAPVAAGSAKAKRLVCIGTYLGFYQDAFFPGQAGRDYTLPTLLEPLAEHRGDFTVFSGLDHRAGNRAPPNLHRRQR